MSQQSVDNVRELLERVADAFGVEATVQVTGDGEEINASLEGDDLGIFIGRHGQTIDAVQHLAYKVASQSTTPPPRVSVDAAGYRQRRAEILQRQADQAAVRAVRNGSPVAMEAMSSVERKVVHEYLRERGDVETYSEGTEPERHLVVAPLRP
jgi:spoIIIJ-associated protein